MRRTLALMVLMLLAAPAWAVMIEAGDTVIAQSDVTVTSSATLVAAAEGTRVALSCTNTHASVHVRWGDGTVTSSSGQRLPAGSSVEIRSVAAIYMISESGDVTITCTRELQ